MIIAIGNAPSSGSTLVADLVDSLPFAVCGPETRLFAVRGYFDDFERLRQEGFFSSRSPVIYEIRQRFLVPNLPLYGFDERRINKCLKASRSFQGFCERFFSIYSAHRGKKCSIFFEKTPENIHCAKLFLDSFRDGIFLHIVRDPIYVYKSLRKRGFSFYIAANTWLIDVSSVYELRNHPRFFTITYEELVRRPFVIVARFLRNIGMEFDPGELERLYGKNTYRKRYVERIDSWSIRNYGTIDDANKKDLTMDDLRTLRFILKTKVSSAYAREFGLPEVTFQELARTNGYSFERFGNSLDSIGRDLQYDFVSFRLLLKKFVFDFLYRDCGVKSLGAYVRPVDSVS